MKHTVFSRRSFVRGMILGLLAVVALLFELPAILRRTVRAKWYADELVDSLSPSARTSSVVQKMASGLQPLSEESPGLAGELLGPGRNQTPSESEIVRIRQLITDTPQPSAVETASWLIPSTEASLWRRVKS